MNIKNIISAIAVSGTLLAGLSGCEVEYQPDYERVYIGAKRRPCASQNGSKAPPPRRRS